VHEAPDIAETVSTDVISRLASNLIDLEKPALSFAIREVSQIDSR
jgi:hypothetical protein